MKGRSAATSISTVAGDAAYAETPAFREWRRLHDSMMACYSEWRFDEAVRHSELLQLQVAAPWRRLYAKLERWFAEAAAAPSTPDRSPVWMFDSK